MDAQRDSQPLYFSADDIGASLPAAFKGVMRAPTDYFAAMPPASGYRNSMILLLIYLSIPVIVGGTAIGILNMLLILPLFLAIGAAGTWMWAWYLGWAARVFCHAQLSTRDAFKICAYGSAPLIFSWIPVLGPLAWFWNLYLNWQGMVSHARLGGGSALLIILGAFVVMAASLTALAVLLIYVNLDFDIRPIQLPAPTWL